MKQTVFFKSILLVMVMLMLGVNMQAATMDDDTNEVSLTGKKWYYTKHDYIEFFEDGTNTYKKSYTYVHDRKNDRILFFKSDGTMYDYVNIYVLTETTLTIGKNDFKTYTTTPPKQLCEELEIAYPNWRITVKTGDKVTIAKSVLPADADDQSVTLYSYDPSVVEVDGETLQGVSPGVTTVKATTNDGSNLTAFCSVNVANETYQLDDQTFPMIETVDLGLPSGTLWADMNIGADAPFRMSKGFGEQMDVAPYVGSGWEYPTDAEFKELIDNCDVKLEEKASDFYWYQMSYQFDYLRAAEFTSRINGNKLTLYVFTVSARGDYCYCLYPYCLQDGTTFSLIENVKECALNPVKEIETEEPKVLVRLVKRGQDGTSIKGDRPFVEDGKVWKVGTVSGNPVQVVDYYYFDGDTIIDGKTCKQMMCQRYVAPDYSDEDWTPEPSLSYVGAWYEENQKVYFYDERTQSMTLKYDFSIGDNESLQLVDDEPPFIIGPKQTGGLEGFKGVYRDVMTSQNTKSTTWLESVGGIDGPMRNVYAEAADHVPEFLMSCTVGDEVIYLNDEYEDGATPEGARKDRIDFTHTIKIKPKAPKVKAPRRIEAMSSLYGEYNDQQLGINLNSLDDAYQVSITDEAGKALYEKTVDAGTIVGLSIDISAYAKGRYTVTVENNSEVFTGEFGTLTTGIEAAVNKAAAVRGTIYDLQGRLLLGKPSKGLYIQDGKKYLAK